MVQMNWFQPRFCSFVTLKFALWSRCMFQQESGHGIMWAYNNAHAMAGFILILIVKTDLTERSLWSKRKACLDSFPRRQCSLNYCCGIWVWAVWLTTVLLWQTSLWTAALAHVDTFVWCSGFCEWTSYCVEQYLPQQTNRICHPPRTFLYLNLGLHTLFLPPLLSSSLS